VSARGRFKNVAAIGALVVLGSLLCGPGVFAQDEFRLSDLGGGALTSSDLDRGATVLVVWASWSPRGRDINDRVNAIAARWGSRARVATVNFQEDRGAVESFLATRPINAPVYLDLNGDFARKHAVTSLPGLLVFVDGRAVFRGKLPDDPDRVLTQALP
jgi:thiol-disulfide isomerase/thioredoxin